MPMNAFNQPQYQQPWFGANPGSTQMNGNFQGAATPYSGQNQYQPIYNQAQQFRAPYQNNQMAGTGIHGRIVSDPSEITAQEVPMDNSMSLFPLADGSCIIAKSWTSDGKIKTVRYSRDVSQPSEQGDALSMIMQRLDSIEDQLYRRKPYNNRKKPQAKQEEVQDDQC